MFNLNLSPEISRLLFKISCAMNEVSKSIVCKNFAMDRLLMVQIWEYILQI